MKCWIAPRNETPGKNFAEEIDTAIEDCELMVLIFSNNTNNSDHVASEVALAFRGKKTIIPFIADNTEMRGKFRYYLAQYQWIVTEGNYSEHLPGLVEVCADWLNYENHIEVNTAEQVAEVQPVKIDTERRDEVDVANDLLKEAEQLTKEARYKEAMEQLTKAKDIYQRVLGEEHRMTAKALTSIGHVYMKQGRYFDALKAANTAMSICEKVLGFNDPDTAMAYPRLGEIYAALANYPRALQFYDLALDIRKAALGPDHADTAALYNDYGEVYRAQGRYHEALERYNMALAIRKKALGANHADTAESYNNIGVVYDDLGDYKHAMEFHRKALAIREKVLGKEHPDTAQS